MNGGKSELFMQVRGPPPSGLLLLGCTGGSGRGHGRECRGCAVPGPTCCTV